LKVDDHRYALNNQCRRFTCSDSGKQIVESDDRRDFFFLLLLLLRRGVDSRPGIRRLLRRKCDDLELRTGQTRLDVVVPEVLGEEIDSIALNLDICHL
jgi:hypothetical protein